MRHKTTCPISLSDFAQLAKDINIEINGVPIVIATKNFASGSFGWYAGDKIRIKVGDQLILCQMSCSITVIGSKPETK